MAWPTEAFSVLTMSLSHELPVLVAPRPVRITSAFAFARRVHNASPSRADNDNSSDHSSQSPSPLSGRSSTLPSEALEEFLSILKPSFFPSTSPTLGKARRALSIPTFHQYERPLALRPRQRIDNAPFFKSDDTSDSHPFATTSPTIGGEQQESSTDQYEQDGPATRWLHFGPLCTYLVYLPMPYLTSPHSIPHIPNPYPQSFQQASH